MKKREEEFVTTEKYVDVSDKEVVNDFMEDAFVTYDWAMDDPTINDYEYFWEGYDLTEEDKERIFSKIQVEAKEEVKRIKEDEKTLLKDRESILEFINYSIGDSYSDQQVGYALSAEEILDTILENGRK